jgi:two-component SAPR family response regulator
MEKMNCLVVDDEVMGRKLIEENVKQIPFLNLVGSCSNAFEAMEVLQKEKVDLIFLDIQMPGILGTSFLSSLAIKPLVIFVTAYANYAVESYNLDAVDYLMKPVSIDRFALSAVSHPAVPPPTTTNFFVITFYPIVYSSIHAHVRSIE